LSDFHLAPEKYLRDAGFARTLAFSIKHDSLSRLYRVWPLKTHYHLEIYPQIGRSNGLDLRIGAVWP
jgi:hypothetical protein